MEEEEGGGGGEKRGCPDGPSIPSLEDEVDRSAVPCPRTGSTLIPHHKLVQRTDNCLVRSTSPVESCISGEKPIKVLKSRPSLRGPRWLVNRRYVGVKTQNRTRRLSTSLSTRNSLATQRLSLQSETINWPLAPWTVSYSSESPKGLHLPGGSDYREVFVPLRASRRHGRYVANTTYTGRRHTMEGSMAQTTSRRERSVLEDVVARDASPGHPQLVRYIARPSKLSPARNPNWRMGVLMETHEEVNGLDASNKPSPKVNRVSSMAGRLRASIRWKKAQPGEENTRLRRAAVRRAATTAADHRKAKLLLLPKDATYQTNAQADPVTVVQEEKEVQLHQDQHR